MLCVIPEDRSKYVWIAAAWKQEWEASGPTRVHRHVSDPGESAKGEYLRRKHWTTLNRLRTGVGRYRSSTAAHYLDHHPKLASSKLGH